MATVGSSTVTVHTLTASSSSSSLSLTFHFDGGFWGAAAPKSLRRGRTTATGNSPCPLHSSSSKLASISSSPTTVAATTQDLPPTVPCGRAVHRAVARSTRYAALTLYPHGRARGLCGRAGVSRIYPETLPGTSEVARGDRATARCAVSHFLASSL
ncbi:hypothetical protein PIB30_082726 [Stylosanthes scabra]|uniref:Uncharacterized protein n=1 Tax=Stylosanthes scabra TaxID=79078 RepID=A0ABU6SU84_9FABA|nr:hypothetical protein [Stylosanthes scabra]